MSKLLLERDPELLQDHLPARAEKKLVLGLDLGTSCGFTCAYVDLGQPVDPTKVELYLGQLDLSAGPYDSGAIRFIRLRQYLSVIKPDLVAFENVRYTPAEKPNRMNIGAIMARAATACEWFGALKATVCTWCEERDIPCTSFPIGTIKKRATNKGNANKEDMIKACNQLFGTDFEVTGYENSGVDNIADAAFVCILAAEEYGKGLAA